MTKKSCLEQWRAGEVSLSLFREFEYFDPTNTPVLFAPFTAYVREARTILANRTSEEIEYACMLAEWVVLAPIDELIEADKNADAALLAELHGHEDETYPRLMQRRQSVLKIAGIPDLRRARWQELYAAMCLAYVARATRCGESSSMEAAEAIQIALAAAQRSKSAAIRYRAWRDKALRYAEGKEDMSANEIATGFLEYYEDELRAKFGDELLAHRTIADWIRESRKRIE